MMLTGRFIDASRAERTGLVSAVVSEEELDAAGRAMAEDMLRASPLGLRMTKDGINQNLNAPSLDAAMALEDRQQILCGHTEDVKEAFHAFVEKRAPTYKDR
jgi:enoyl-CoA hydratase/carnithine racemase